jgi:hypothetical protein
MTLELPFDGLAIMPRTGRVAIKTVKKESKREFSMRPQPLLAFNKKVIKFGYENGFPAFGV